MPVTPSSAEKPIIAYLSYMKVLLVIFAFGLMIFSSNMFMRGVVEKHMGEETRDKLNYMKTLLDADIAELETLLDTISETVADMIKHGADSDKVTAYIVHITEYLRNSETSAAGFVTINGVFDVFDGLLCVGLDIPTQEGFVPEERPWYKAAEAASGGLAVTNPYVDALSGDILITFSQCIYDENNRKLATLCIDVSPKSLRGLTRSLSADGNSNFGLLLDTDLNILVHPDHAFRGAPLDEIQNDIKALADELTRENRISASGTKNYNGEMSAIFAERLEIGWVIGVVASIDDYAKDISNINRFFIALGAVLAAILSILLIRLDRGRAHAETQIRKEKEKSEALAFWYQSILNAVPLPISVTDANMKWTFFNSAVEKTLDIKYKDALGMQCSKYNKHICDTDMCGIACAKRGESRTYFKHNGSSYQVDIEILKNMEGEADGFIEVVQDITQIEEIAKQKAEIGYLAKILNGMDAMIYVTDPKTSEILFINDNMKQHYGIKGDAIGQLCYKILQDGLDEQCDFCPCRQLDKEPDKTVIWQEHSTVTNRDYRNSDRYMSWLDGRTVHIQHSVDITDRILIEHQLIAAKESAEQSDRAKSIFLANMSHEIRTPMNAVLGVTEIQLQNQTLSPEIEEAFVTIYDSGNLLLNIINDILDLSKIEAGKMEIVPVKYDVPSLISDTAQINFLRYESKPINFKLHVDADTPLELLGDEMRIKQILNNLLSNAFKYTEKGEVKLSVSIEPYKDDCITIVFQISDTGQGMTEEQLNQIFDEYARFNIEANSFIGGAGLGMSITKRLVSMMDGKIHVESEFGKGTSFTVRLPQQRIGSAVCGAGFSENLRRFRYQGAAKSYKMKFIREYMPYGRVLIVDDVESNLYVAKGLLLPYGLKIEIASSGIAAIEKIRNGNTYDIVFMDHMMPQMDGMEAVSILRSMGYNHTIVALTANAVTGQSEIFLANGFDGFISKPIDSRELNAVLNDFVRDKQPPEVIAAARQETSIQAVQASISCEIAEAFVNDAEKALTVLDRITTGQNPATDKDIQLYTTTVHGMKSALANIGETKLSNSALHLEQAGRKGETNIIQSNTPAFLDALREIIEKYRRPEESCTTEISGEDGEYLREKLLVIKEACAKFDKKTAKDTLAEIKQKAWPQEIKEALDTVAGHLLHSEFKKVAKVLDETILLIK